MITVGNRSMFHFATTFSPPWFCQSCRTLCLAHGHIFWDSRTTLPFFFLLSQLKGPPAGVSTVCRMCLNAQPPGTSARGTSSLGFGSTNVALCCVRRFLWSCIERSCTYQTRGRSAKDYFRHSYLRVIPPSCPCPALRGEVS